MQKTGVAFLHKEFFHGGTEKVSINLAGEFSKRGFRCYAFCSDYKPWDCLEDNRTPLKVCLMPQDRSDASSDRYMRAVAEKVRQLEIGYLIVTYPFFDNLHLVRRSCSAKIVFLDHSVPFWQIDSRIGLRQVSWKKRLWKLLTAVPKEKIGRHYSRRWLPLYRYTYDVCDAYVVLADAYGVEISRRLGVDGRKIHTVPNFSYPVGKGDGPKKKEVLYCGRMTYKDKRVDRLLRIWERVSPSLPDWNLILVGEGPEKEKSERYASRRHLRNIRFEGWQQDLRPYYRRASVICLTSTFESFGMVLVEAMSAGCVPMAFGCSAGVSSVVGPDCGILVRPFDETAYARELAGLLEDPSRLEALSLKALARSGDFQAEPVVSLWMKLFAEI